jgi:flagella basal body P-ring formation protein FlgA
VGARVVSLLLALLPAAALAAGVVRIDADPAVETGRITLGQIAELDALDPDVERQLASLELGDAAAPGRHRVLSGATLRERIAELAPHAALDVPAEVRVHSAYREITPEFVQARVEEGVRHLMPWPAEAVRFSDWRLPPAFAVPAHAGRFLVHFQPDERYVGNVTARIEAIDPADPDGARISRAASVVVDVRMAVPVTARALRRGDVLMDDAVRMEERDLSGLPRDAVLQLDRVIGRTVARSLQPGMPLVGGYFEAERVVRRGDLLDVTAEVEGLELRVEVRALEDGSAGDAIRAENPTTRRRFVVQVVGPGKARLRSTADVGAQ